MGTGDGSGRKQVMNLSGDSALYLSDIRILLVMPPSIASFLREYFGLDWYISPLFITRVCYKV